MKENKSKSLRLTLARLMKFYNELICNEGTLATEGDFVVGAEVYVLNNEGEFVPAEGEYTVDDVKYVVSAGVITAITVNEKPVEPAEQAAEEENLETEQTAENENLAEETEPTEPAEPETDERDARIAELEAENETLRNRVTELEGIVAERDARIAELEAIVEEYRQREQTAEPSVEEEDLALAKQEPVKKEDNVSKGVALMRAIRSAKGE